MWFCVVNISCCSVPIVGWSFYNAVSIWLYAASIVGWPVNNNMECIYIYICVCVCMYVFNGVPSCTTLLYFKLYSFFFKFLNLWMDAWLALTIFRWHIPPALRLINVFKGVPSCTKQLYFQLQSFFFKLIFSHTVFFLSWI